MPTVTMPQLGESVAEGTIGKWLKQVGDQVDRCEPIVEVVTDKVNAEVPSPFEGVLTQILVEEGADGPQRRGDRGHRGGAAPPRRRRAAPVLRPGRQRSGRPDERPPRPRPLLRRQRRGTGAAAACRTGCPLPARPPAPAAAGRPPSTDGSAARRPPTPGRMTPAVRRLAREHGVDLARVAGTGFGGRVTRDDIDGATSPRRQAARPAAAPPAPRRRPRHRAGPAPAAPHPRRPPAPSADYAQAASPDAQGASPRR